MGIQIVIVFQFLICGMAVAGTLSSPTNVTTNANSTENRSRSNRKNDDQQQYVSIPVGYYRPPSQSSSDSTETDRDPNPKYDVPTSFDDFVSSDKKTRDSYLQYKGESYKYQPVQKTYNWKGDVSSDDNSPTWITPSPADMMTMLQVMKAMDGDKASDVPSGPLTGLLSKLTSDPMTTLVAIILPVSVLLAAIIPVFATLFTNANGSNIPTVTTVASGNNGRKLDENQSLVRSILEAIENFSARTATQTDCLQKSFCEATRGGTDADGRSIQRNLYKAFTYVDDYWLQTLGMKELMEALGTGNCDNIQCDTSRQMGKRRNAKKE